MKNRAAEDLVRAARAKAVFRRPYFAHALYAAVLVETDEVPNVGIDRWCRIYYNPSFVLRFSVDQIATVLIHEIIHKLRGHHERAALLGVGEATFQAAVCAMNCEINDDLQRELVEQNDLPPLPDWCEFPAKFGLPDDRVWEWYYERLLGDVDGKIDSANDCGSGAHGVQRRWELDAPSDTVDGIRDADWRDIMRRVAESIRSHAGRGRGSVPGHWIEWSDAVLQPIRIPWEHELASGLRSAATTRPGRVFYSYQRPSRRQQAVPHVALPCMRRRRPVVVIVTDTSGSMGLRELALVRGTVSDICRSLGAQVIVLATDTEVHGVQRVQGGRDIELRGRGGTDMSVGIGYAATMIKPRPNVIVVASDCMTPWPSRQPDGIRVIVAAINSNGEERNCPSWAKVIVVDPDQEAA